MNTLRFKLIGLVLSLTLVGCTKLSDSSSVQIAVPQTMKFSKVGKQAISGELTHAVLNASASDMPLKNVQWDRHDSPGSAAPDQFEIPDIPNGSDRLFQVLAIYRVESGMAFMYGESKQAISTNNQLVTITLGTVGSGQMVSGRITGRYLDGPNFGPTGRVAIKYYPNEQSAGMVIEHSYITNGWFSFFVLDGSSTAKLGYELDNGRKLWGKTLNLSDPEFDPTLTTKVVRAAIPVHIRADGGPGTMGMQWKYEEANSFALGFFGDSAHTSPHNVCRPTSAEPLTKLSVWAGSIGVSPPAMPGVIITSGTVAFPTVAQLVATPNSIGGYRVKGGIPSGCTADIEEDMNLANLPSWMDGNGQDGVTPFFPPLVAQGSGGSMGNRGPFQISMGSTNISLSGQMLPGVGSDIFNNIRVYKRPNSSNWEWHNGGPPCNDMARLSFQEVTPSTSISGGSFNINVPLVAGDVSNGLAVGVCFEGPAQIQNAGIVLNRYNFQNNGGGGGGGGANYLRLEITDANFGGNNHLMTQGYCHPAKFSSYQGMGSTHVLPGTAAVSVTGLPTSGSLAFYSDSNCTAGTTGASIPGGTYQGNTLYVKGTVGLSNHQVSGLSVVGYPTTFDAATNMIDVGMPKLRLEGPSRVMSSMCYGFSGQALMATGFSYPQSSTTLSYSFINQSNIYSNPNDCAMSSSPISTTLSGGQSSMNFFAKTTSGSNGTFSVTGPSFMAGTIGVIVSTTGGTQGRYLRMEPLTPPLIVSKCNPIRVSVVNENEVEIPVTEPLPLRLFDNATAGVFYTDGGCSQQDPLFALMPGESGRVVYYTPNQSGAVSVGGVPNSLPISPGTTLNASLPGSGPYMTFYPPGLMSKIIGSHEFNSTARQITLTTPGGTVDCSFFNGSTWDPCSGGEFNSATKVFTWQLAAAVAGTRYRFRNNMPGFSTVEVEFDPKKVYGEAFQVLTCGHEIVAGTGTVAVQTALANSSPICLGNGVGLDCAGTTGSLGVGMKVIGWSNKNNVTNSVGSATCFQLSGANIGDTVTMLANLNMNFSTSSPQVKGFSIYSLTSSGSLGAVVLANSQVTTDAISAGLAYGLFIQNNAANLKLRVQDTAFMVNTANSGVNNSVIMTGDNQAPLEFVDSSFGVTGASTNTRTAISFNPGGVTPGPIIIRRSSIIGTNLKLLGVSASGTLGPVSITNSQINVTTTNSSIIDLFGSAGGDHVFANNLITYNGGASYQMFNLNGYGQTFNPKFINNKFVHTTQGQLISMNTSNGGTVPNIEFTRNSFLSTSTTSSGNSRVFNISGTDTYNLISSLGTPTGGNVICETDAGTHGWSGGPLNPAPVGGSLTAFPSVISSVTPVANACP